MARRRYNGKGILTERDDPTEGLLGKVRTLMYGKTGQKELDKVDLALSNISTDVLSKNSRNYAEIMHKVFSNSITQKDLENAPNVIVSDMMTIARMSRYISAEEICDSIPYCARALKVLKDGVCSPDDITKKTIQLLSTEDSSDDNDQVEKDVRNIIRDLKIEPIMDTVIYETLKLGDQFIEICDYTTDEVPITQSLLQEGLITEQEVNQTFEIKMSPDSTEVMKVQLEIIQDSGDDGIEQLLEDVELDNLGSILEDNGTQTKKTTDEDPAEGGDTIDLRNIRIIVHDPRTVIKLQSRRYKMCLGYLVLPYNEQFTGPLTGMNSAPGTGGFGSANGRFHTGMSSLMPGSDSSMVGIDALYKDLIGKIKKHLNDKEIVVNKKEVMDMITRAISEVEDEDEKRNPTEVSKLQIRYVPVNRMEHFFLSSQRFFPYGEGIFFKSTLKAKMLIALETSMTMKRVSDSMDRRVWYVESGLPRDARNLIEELKMKFKKKKFSIDGLGSISTIASQMNFNEDLYIPQTKGKRFVEPDVLAPAGDIRGFVEDLKYLRDEIVANLEVPPAYLNLEENLCTSLSTAITYTDGSVVTLQEIIDEFETGNKDIWIHSFDHSTGKIVPGKVTWAGKTRQNAIMVRVHLDNEKYIDCTPDHKFMLRDGSYKEAQHLSPNESLMPFYTQNTNSVGSHGLSYMMIYHPGINKWQKRYHSFADALNLGYGKGYAIHHADGNPRNDHPSNLKSVSFREHAILHRDWGKRKIESGGVMYHMVECRICKKQFKCKTCTDQVTCSPECKSAYHRLTGLKSWDARKDALREKYPYVTRICDWCGEEFQLIQTTKYLENQTAKSYMWYSCSNPECSKKIKYANISMGKMHGLLKKDITYINCEICGKLCISCETDNSKIFKTVCRVPACSNTKIARDSALKRRHRHNITCAVCGKVVEKHDYYKTMYPETCGHPDCFAENCSRIHRGMYVPRTIDVDPVVEEISSEPVLLNHKVVKVEWLEERMDCGDLEVEKYHNFAVDAGVIIHNSNKSALSFENAIFAQTIVSYQNVLSNMLQAFIEKVYVFTKKKKMKEGISLSFPPPKMLQLERDAEKFDMIGRIVQVHKELGIEEEWTKKNYVDLPHEQIKRAEIKAKLDDKMSPPNPDDAGLGGMGGMGGSMGGMPSGY